MFVSYFHVHRPLTPSYVSFGIQRFLFEYHLRKRRHRHHQAMVYLPSKRNSSDIEVFANVTYIIRYGSYIGAQLRSLSARTSIHVCHVVSMDIRPYIYRVPIEDLQDHQTNGGCLFQVMKKTQYHCETGRQSKDKGARAHPRGSSVM